MAMPKIEGGGFTVLNPIFILSFAGIIACGTFLSWADKHPGKVREIPVIGGLLFDEMHDFSDVGRGAVLDRGE